MGWEQEYKMRKALIKMRADEIWEDRNGVEDIARTYEEAKEVAEKELMSKGII